MSTQRKSTIKRKSTDHNEWSNLGEGFSGFHFGSEHTTGTCSINPTKRVRTEKTESFTNALGKIPIPKKVDETIAWSSSDEEESVSSQRSKNRVLPAAQSDSTLRKGTQNRGHDVGDDTSPDLTIADHESSSEAWLCRKTPDASGDGQDTHSQVSDPVGIQGYESDGSRQAVVHGTEGRSQDCREMSPDIESTKSESPALSQASLSSKVKASDWVKNLNLKTPSKDSQPSDTDVLELEDSAQKKKKFKRGSFADQLMKIQQREQSSGRIWSHQQVSGQLGSEVTSSRSIVIKVVSFEVLYSLMLARCTGMMGPDKSRDVLVLFSASIVKQHSIKQGSVIRIHPPWQQLALKHSQQTVMLCTNYCQVMDDGEPSSSDSLMISQGSPKVMEDAPVSCKVTRYWNCPCVADLVSDYRSCPAHLLPSMPAVTVPMDPVVDGEGGASGHSSDERSRLQLVQATQNAPVATTSRPSHTLLGSIHRQDTTQGLCFTGLIHRVIQNRDRYHLVVEDIQGTMCKIILGQDRTEVWDKAIQGEGKAYHFTGLAIHSRTNRERDVGLFSLIDAVWSGVPPNTHSQDSEQSETTSTSCTVEPPGFCYVIKEDNSVPVGVTVAEVTSLVSQYRSLSPVSLDCAFKNRAKTNRFCFVARIIAILISTQDTQEVVTSAGPATPRDASCLAYVTDGSHDFQSPSGYSIVRCIGANRLKDAKSGHIRFFKDVTYHEEQLCCDTYSQIEDITTIQEMWLCSHGDMTMEDTVKRVVEREITLPKLSCELPNFALCQVQGKICSVEESSAYSWEVCSHCGSDKLVYKTSYSGGDLLCLECQKAVPAPVTKMAMDVYVDCCHLQASVKISLLRECIESLLPDDAEEEGYEVSSVMRKEIGPLYCVLCSKTVEKDGQVENLQLQQVLVSPCDIPS